MVAILAFAMSHKLALAGTALSTVLVPYFWRAARAVGRFFTDWLFAKKKIDTDWTANVLLGYLNAKAKSFGVKDDMYHAEREHVKIENGDLRTIFFLQSGQSHRIFLYKGALISLTPPEAKEGGLILSAYVRFLRGTVDWPKLLIDAADYNDEKNKANLKHVKNFRVVRHVGCQHDTENEAKPAPGVGNDQRGSMVPIGWSADDLGIPTPEDPIDTLALSPGMEHIFQSVRFWHTHKDWYRERSLPWRRGFLLYGLPGNGKTSIVRAVAEYLDLPVHVFSLATMDSQDFSNAWKDTQGSASRIVLLEDFDSVFVGRKNVNEKSDLTFDTILNTLDGIEREDGLLLFVTTNNVDTIDPALGAPDKNGRSTRPGRIDETVEIPNIDHKGRLKLARRIIRDEEWSAKLALEGDGDSAVQFQERCRQFAEDQLWSKSL